MMPLPPFIGILTAMLFAVPIIDLIVAKESFWYNYLIDGILISVGLIVLWYAFIRTTSKKE